MPEVARLEKVKRPGGSHVYDVEPLVGDEHGSWFRAPVGSPWRAPHDSGLSVMAVVLLVAADRPWVSWWVADPVRRRLELDVCLPPTPDAAGTGWRFVDLELDVLRHEDGPVEVEDEDEYAEALREGWMSPDDGRLARRTADDLVRLLAQGESEWERRGWDLLDALGERV